MARKIQKIRSKARKIAEDHDQAPAPAWRVQEAIGIGTLSSALLAGPSLFSVQFGDGRLMGPFGELVGRSIHWALGLSGYLVVAGLVLISLKIFAGALGAPGRFEPSWARWRRGVGTAQAVAFGAVLLHLVFRPETLVRASYGGVVGEVGGEILCALLSTPGAWVVCLAGLALSLVLATRFSWARAAIWLWHQARQIPGAVATPLSRVRGRAVALLRYLGRQLATRREPVVTSADGTAAMPPMLRLELQDEADACDAALDAALARTMPVDLEIGKAAELPLLGIEPEQIDDPADRVQPLAVEPAPAAGADASEPSEAAALAGAGSGDRAAPGSGPGEDGEGCDGRGQGQALATRRRRDAREAEQELTIVETHYETRPVEPTAEADDKQVEQTDGPGFVLNHETYRSPPLSLLEIHETEQAQVDRAVIYTQADRLVKALADYKINGRVTKVHPGPVVTMYEFVPAPGTRVAKVANLANDLAMSLKALRVRIVAPIPGKGAIGIEVPNDQRETVSFKQIVSDDAFRSPKSTLTLAIGKNIFGAPVTMDLARMPHLLVAGATGAGKSVSINGMICSLLLKSTPEEVRMIMVDPKFLELSGYNDIPHLLLPVVTDPKKANIALRWAVAEMERRYQLLAGVRVRDIAAYNRKVAKLRGETAHAAASDAGEAVTPPQPPPILQEARPSKVLVVRKRADGTEEPLSNMGDATDEASSTDSDEHATGDSSPADPRPAPSSPSSRGRRVVERELRRLPYIVVIIDEFADLMMIAPKEVESSVARLAQKARAAGIHLIVATQRPSVDVITGLIKANFPSRMAFQVASGHDSKTILGSQGAENLLGAGDMLVLDRGTEMKRIHGAYLSDEEIKRVVEWLREQGRPVYDMDILTAPDEDEQGPDEPEEQDEFYDRAVQIVSESGQVSISMIQRRLRIGYNRSARIVERMEREGIVSAADGPRGREVLVQSH